MVETPTGVLVIRMEWVRWGGAFVYMTLYGGDGWPVGTRSWAEQFSEAPERDDGESLAHVISEWTGMSPADAEAFAEETVSRWRRSSAFERDLKIGRWSVQLMLALAGVAVLALGGIAALVWLVVSALT